MLHILLNRHTNVVFPQSELFRMELPQLNRLNRVYAKECVYGVTRIFNFFEHTLRQ
jgi:hypothetical protein